MTPKYVKSVLNEPDESGCETAMTDRNMAFGAEFYRCVIRKQYLRFLTPSLWIQRTMK